MDKARSSMKTQFMIMMIAASFFTMFVVCTMVTMTMISNSEKEVEEFRQILTADVERELKDQTQTALSAIQGIYEREKAGIISPAQARIDAAAIVRDLRYADGDGYFWIDTYEGVNVALLGRDVEGKSRIDATDQTGKHFIRELIENGRKAGGGYTDFMFAKPGETEPLPKRGYTAAFEPYQWVVGTGVWIDYIDARVAEAQARADENLHSIFVRMTILAVVIAVIMIIAAAAFSNHLIAPIRRMTEVLDVLSTGDFRLKDNGKNADTERSDEIGVMARAVVALRDNVHEMIEKIITSAAQVAAASEQLTASADQSTTAINQVADSIVNVAGACTEQFTEVENASTKADELKSHMESFNKTLHASAKEIAETNVAADNGNKAVKNAISQMERIETSVSASADVIAQLGEESEKIGKIVDAIVAIADQTNLLALNAAIEAARAGEHGKGFAVVADEVRKLAEQSQSSAKEISTLIGSIQEKSQDAVQAMQEGVTNVKTGAEAVDDAGRTFQIISEKVTEVSKSSERMEKIVGELSASTDVITQSVENINVKSREVAKESETVSASGEQQSATMHEIAEASRSLAEMAQAMQDIIGRFKV
ncbi:MAG: cache domain-containing protein [Selenomonadaceae bacterium]|nr:cache domain-containing protein [Selenomonadaceae bacterium]